MPNLIITKKFLTIALLFLCCSCSFSNLIIKGKGDLKLRQIAFEDMSGWQNDDQNRAVVSLVNSCNQFAKMPDDKQIGGKIGDIVVGDFHDVCDIAQVVKGMSSKQARNFFENWFVPFEVSDRNGNDQGLFTGYFVPELRGSKNKTEIYQYPVYSRPKDLNGEAYLTREEIEDGALENKGLELVYVDDKVDLFFMQIQGSGRVVLEDGSVMRLGFGGKNNQPYSSIGKHIIENNIIDNGDSSYFSIKSWLKNNPEEARKLMNVNQSYVFFKPSNIDAVIGSQGVPLMPYRSLAVDTDIIPVGFPMWLDINTPNKPYRKLVIAQDTGSAIKGAVRGDVFFGRGKDAENLAARMNYRGKYFILLPTAAVDRMVGR
jgi:membrane-bound lytic murein transglycosylase A